MDSKERGARLKPVERELFQKRTRSLRRELQTCQETIANNSNYSTSRRKRSSLSPWTRKPEEKQRRSVNPTTLSEALWSEAEEMEYTSRSLHEKNAISKESDLANNNLSSPSASSSRQTPSSKRSSATNKSSVSSTSGYSSGDAVYLGFGKVGRLNDDVVEDISGTTDVYSEEQKTDNNLNQLCTDCDNVPEDEAAVQGGAGKDEEADASAADGRPRNMRSILCKQPRPLMSDPRLDTRRASRSKKFSCATPSTALDLHSLPSKPRSPRKSARSKASSHIHRQLRIEPGRNMNPSQSLEVKTLQQQEAYADVERMDDLDEHVDSTQARIKEFLDKACADAARARTKMGPTISLSDLASIDEQQTSMPILVEGVLGPEERKRQVSKVYPMRTPSPLHNSLSRLQGSHGSRSTSRASRGDHHQHHPLILPPIILPPIRENKEFKPRQSSLAQMGEGSVGVSKPITEDDWRSLRRCRYLRIPDAPNDVTFDLMDTIDSIFK